MASMSRETRSRIIEAAKHAGFLVQLKDGINDLYDKNLVFQARTFESLVYVHRETGIIRTSGNFSYLKVAVHPESFRPDLLNPAAGIEDYINQKSKQNRHHSSNYRTFPTGIPGKAEPYGMCYKVQTLDALSNLMMGLARSA